MSKWCDVIDRWFTGSSDDRWTDEGAVIYVYSASRYFLIAESVDYFFTAVPQAYTFITENHAFAFESISQHDHYVTQNSANYFEAKQ